MARACALIGTGYLMAAWMGNTFAGWKPEDFREIADMSLFTFVALSFATFAVLSLFVHRGGMRSILLRTENGARARLLIFVGLLFPWMAGIALQLFSQFAPERLVREEAYVFAGLVLINAIFITTTASRYDLMDRQRRGLLSLLNRRANEDHLTGLTSRSAGMQALEERFKTFRSDGRGITLAMLDLDDFKLINDHFGHTTGDEALRAVAQVLRRHCRGSEVAIRWGGEEFLLLLNTESEDTAVVRVVTMLEEVGKLEMAALEGAFPLSFSAGLAHFEEGDLSVEPAIARADEGLYESKSRKPKRKSLPFKREGESDENVVTMAPR